MDERTKKDVEDIIVRRNLPSASAKIFREWAERLWYGFQKRYGEPKTKEDYQRFRHDFVTHATRQRRRILCVIHYGGDPPKCACCGESRIEFLTIDHHGIAPDKRHRSGDNLYRWLIRSNFPEGFRVLCMNCNHYIGHYGWCPHELEKKRF
jgi:hypothetical protein